MLRMVASQFTVALRVVIILSILTGILYPSVITGIAQLIFPWRSNGSLIAHNNKNIGSLLIGQYFTNEKYFWGRPSATSPLPYDAEHSSGSNLAISNPIQIQNVKLRVEHWKASNPDPSKPIPIDLVTSSASGLDPEISPEAAYYQVSRVAKVRNLPEETVRSLVERSIENRTFRIFGEPRIKVFLLNLSLDQINSKTE